MENREIQMDEKWFNFSARNSADALIRTAQQHHAQISAMADIKANIIITASSIVLTLALGQMSNRILQPTLVILGVFIFLALLCAILAVLPKFRHFQWKPGEQNTTGFNVLFFPCFSSMTPEQFMTTMSEVLSSDKQVYFAALKDLYSIGYYLDKYKYRYLRMSYIFFLLGFILAAITHFASSFLR